MQSAFCIFGLCVLHEKTDVTLTVPLTDPRQDDKREGLTQQLISDMFIKMSL
jgi:hypothetical protein